LLPTDKQFEKEHDQLVNELGKLLMSHPVAKTSSFHSFAALAQCAMKALVQSGAGAADAENVWKTAFTTLYPIEQKHTQITCGKVGQTPSAGARRRGENAGRL
jgi:hypothetical protein